jgi:hypothetical protein
MAPRSKSPSPLAYTAGTLLEATRQISQGLPWFFNRQGNSNRLLFHAESHFHTGRR